MGLGFISYSVSNDAAFTEKVKIAQALVGNLKIPFEQIFTDFQKSRRAIFALSGPGKYPPFKNSARATSLGQSAGNFRKKGAGYTTQESPYERRKILKFGFSYPLLRATGRLEASITSENADTIKYNDGKLLLIGTRVPYGVYHQSSLPRKKIPLRKFLFIGPEAPEFVDDVRGNLDRYTKILDQYIKRSLGATFKGSQE